MKRVEDKEEEVKGSGDVADECSLAPLLERCREGLVLDLDFYEKHVGSVRVGRSVSTQPKDYPSFGTYTQIVCLTKSTPYGDIGPYVIKDEKGRLMENLWQFSKVYEVVPESTQQFSRFNKTIVWSYPKEVHVRDGELQEEYWNWRKKGMEAPEPVRYPVGRENAKYCLYSLIEKGGKKLSYLEGRKQIYAPVFMYLTQQETKFQALKKRLEKGEKLLIIEVDGPHQESLGYYKSTYNVDDKFIERSTTVPTIQNLKIFLNDTRHPFGHGYCLAMALLGLTIQALE
eukprot:TRINITY_DN1532_c0_g1_i1.p1 TRINITY_DN1532_c0_g1~~TRINITY_DN1532_c0_g1_i1.p1  ORF type:complete len:286 (-),score=78.59 TRINITY_DN1532_c0_g1_i1:44-901(-)